MSDYGFGGEDAEFGGFGFGSGNGPDNKDTAQADRPPVPDEFDLDLTDAEDVPDWTPIPAGPYVFMVHEATPDWAKTGSAMVRLQLKVWEGPHEGRFIKDQLVLPNKAKQPADKYKKSVDFFTHNLECITGEKWKGEQRKLNPKRDLENRICHAYVTVKPNQNDRNLMHNEIARYLPREGSTTTPSGGSSGSVGFTG